MSVEMKTLTIGSTTYEIVDETAREAAGKAVSAVCVQKESGDVTDLLGTESCRYIFGDAVTGMPIEGKWWFVDALSNGNADLVITATSVSSAPARYIRVCMNNVWGDWIELASSDHDHDIFSLSFLGDNPTGGVDNDTVATWTELGQGVAWLSELNQVVNQPAQYGFIINYIHESDVFQIFHDQTDSGTYIRSGDGINSWFQTWSRIPTANGDDYISVAGVNASEQVSVSNNETSMTMYANGISDKNGNLWIDSNGEAYFKAAYANEKKLATEEAVATKMPLKTSCVTVTESTTVGNSNAEKMVIVDSAADVTITAESDPSIPIGTIINVVNIGTGTVTLAAQSGVTLYTKDDKKIIDGQYAAVTLYRGPNGWYGWGALA